MVLEWLLRVEQVVDLVSTGCLCFCNFNSYWPSVHHEMSAPEISLCEKSVARWVVFQGSGLPYSIAFEQCPLSSECTVRVWRKDRLRKLTPGNLHALGKKIFHLRRCPGVLAAACISVCRGSARHYPFSLSVFLHNLRFSVENKMWWFQQVIDYEV